ncbi:MAG TPA: retropepsin-like aspartic protease [Verrucomicrobiae bacterium]|jgi:hypothetical protein
MRFLHGFRALSLSLFLYFCGALSQAAPALPPETSFDKYAGRGKQLFLPIRFADNQELRFLVDTGCYFSIIDNAFEPKLGKRLGQSVLHYGYLGDKQAWLYREPPLYLGGFRLHTGKLIATDDLRRVFGVDGILGTDCLKNYCVQLDFDSDKIRFLDPRHLQTENLGKAFHLEGGPPLKFMLHDFFGLPSASVAIDTAEWDDFSLFGKQLPETFGAQVSVLSNAVLVPCVVLENQTYTNLIAGQNTRSDFVGLRFSGRPPIFGEAPCHV